jgi:hypothetical protein
MVLEKDAPPRAYPARNEAVVLDAQPEARDEIAQGSGHQGFAGSRHCDHAGRGMHGDAVDVISI